MIVVFSDGNILSGYIQTIITKFKTLDEIINTVLFFFNKVFGFVSRFDDQSGIRKEQNSRIAD